MYASNGKTLVNPSRGEKCQCRRLGSLTAQFVVVSLLLLGVNVCTHAAPAGPINGVEPVRSQPIQHKPAPPRDDYVPPTAAEMSPMPSRYLAELATIREPPEMADKPMQVRHPVPPIYGKFTAAMAGIGSISNATHAQLATGLRKLIALTNDRLPSQLAPLAYGVIATIACMDGNNPNTVIDYATKAIGGRNGDSAFALRARMYLAEGNKSKALDDLQKLMVRNDGPALILDGGVAPPRKATACSWSIPSMDALAGGPLGIAAKGLYLSSFLAFGYGDKDPTLEAQIRSLYARSERSWHSPIPYFLAAVTLTGLGSEEMTTNSKCARGLLSESTACAVAEHDVMRNIRELTMALVIDPSFGPALSARAEDYLNLAQDLYADGKPSLKFFKLAIADFTAAIAVPGTDKSMLYNDRGLALGSIGEYAESAASYVEGMKLAKHGTEKDSSVYEQLAGAYMKMGRFTEAAQTLTGAIKNSNTGLVDVVVLSGLKTFRALYPQYDLVPDKIVAEDVRRRYEPQLPESWDSTFITNTARDSSPDLADLYALRGDAYMKAGRRRAALEDFSRLKSDAWSDGPQRQYFTADGGRNHDVPAPWPGPPPVH